MIVIKLTNVLLLPSAMIILRFLLFDAISDLSGPENTEFEEKVEMYSNVLEKIEKIIVNLDPVTESDIMIGLGLNEEQYEEGISNNATLHKRIFFVYFYLKINLNDLSQFLSRKYIIIFVTFAYLSY